MRAGDHVGGRSGGEENGPPAHPKRGGAHKRRVLANKE